MSGGRHEHSWACDCPRCLRDPDPAPAEMRLTDFSEIWSLPLDIDRPLVDDQPELDVVRQVVERVPATTRVVSTRRVGPLEWETVTVVEGVRYRAVIR